MSSPNSGWNTDEPEQRNGKCDNHQNSNKGGVNMLSNTRYEGSPGSAGEGGDIIGSDVHCTQGQANGAEQPRSAPEIVENVISEEGDEAGKYCDEKLAETHTVVNLDDSNNFIIDFKRLGSAPSSNNKSALCLPKIALIDESPAHYYANRSESYNKLTNQQVNILLSHPAAATESFLAEPDPLCLSSKLKTEKELLELEKSGANKKLINFYKEQNDLIEELTAPLVGISQDEARRNTFKLQIAIYGSAVVNIMLFALQLAAALLSGSLSLYATTADAFMDLLSSAIIIATSNLAAKKEMYRYPAGKGRFETAGVIVFASLMATLSMQLIVKAGECLTGTPESPDLGIVTIAFVSIALLSKFIMYMYCRLLRSHPAAQVLAQDQRNDIVVNGLGLALGILGSRVNPIIDPIGAIIVACIILRSWSVTVLEQCELIVGKTADSIFLKKVIYIAMNHDARILQVDTCRVYHAGSKVIAEVDIVLPPETSLQVSHDVGETLQIKLESLPNVDRAFVHCDYEATHVPEHQQWD